MLASMPDIRPLHAIRYAQGIDPSRVIAPPFDVLDAARKAELLARDPHNIVAIDLPHIPPKAAGPDHLYAQSATTYQAWLKAGVLVKDRRPALYPYSQAFEHGGRQHRRRGFFALVKLSPFGDGHVVPHEKTYPGAIEDRLKLMKATGLGLSPIFGLYEDPRNRVVQMLFHDLGRPMMSGMLDNVRNDLWAMPDAEVENKVIDFLGLKGVYIADGHHRYTTALQYKAEMEKRNGGPLPPAHPANWCLFVLVSMHDPGLLVHPTHRLIGSLKGFSIPAFAAAIAPHFEVAEAPFTVEQIGPFTNEYLRQHPHTMGLFDGAGRKLYLLRLKNLDVLAALEPGHSEAWRQLDVAILQRFLLDEVLVPRFAGGTPIVPGYTADAADVAPQVDGQRYQIALLLQPTPVKALEDLGRAKEVMPQKSTFFWPKLATGLVINPLEV
jgi:uncharacterized protein (DUF1015 family)